jgi:hypothetical protein
VRRLRSLHGHINRKGRSVPPDLKSPHPKDRRFVERFGCYLNGMPCAFLVLKGDSVRSNFWHPRNRLSDSPFVRYHCNVIAAARDSLVRLSGRQPKAVSATAPACVEIFRSSAWRIGNTLKSIDVCSRRSASH